MLYGFVNLLKFVYNDIEILFLKWVYFKMR